MRSRKILGWRIDLIPNTLTIVRSFSMLVDTGGLPGNALIDNGKDFKSRWFAGSAWKDRKVKLDKEGMFLMDGILQECGCKAHFATPYRGQSKPIERLFGTVIQLFSKSRDFYTGSNTVDAPEDRQLYWKRINGRDRIVTYTLEKLREDFGRFVSWYNSCWNHSGNGMGGGTPDEVFFANLVSKREMPRELRKYIFTIREQRVVQRNGVLLDGISYYNEKLIGLIGDRVEVRRDINDIGKVAVFSLPDCVYQFDAESDMFKDSGCTEEQIRKARASQKKAKELVKTNVADADAIRKSKMTPAEILAEQSKGIPADGTRHQSPAEIPLEMRKIAGGEPLKPAPTKRKLLLPTDPGVELLYAEG
jgi:hypothetical protein